MCWRSTRSRKIRQSQFVQNWKSINGYTDEGKLENEIVAMPDIYFVENGQHFSLRYHKDIQYRNTLLWMTCSDLCPGSLFDPVTGYHMLNTQAQNLKRNNAISSRCIRGYTIRSVWRSSSGSTAQKNGWLMWVISYWSMTLCSKFEITSESELRTCNTMQKDGSLPYLMKKLGHIPYRFVYHE